MRACWVLSKVIETIGLSYQSKWFEPLGIAIEVRGRENIQTGSTESAIEEGVVECRFIDQFAAGPSLVFLSVDNGMPGEPNRSWAPIAGFPVARRCFSRLCIAL